MWTKSDRPHILGFWNFMHSIECYKSINKGYVWTQPLSTRLSLKPKAVSDFKYCESFVYKTRCLSFKKKAFSLNVRNMAKL